MGLSTSPSAEISPSPEITAKAASSVEAAKNKSRTEYFKKKALFYFMAGNKNRGNICIQKAIKAAEKEQNANISMAEIEQIMQGKAPKVGPREEPEKPEDIMEIFSKGAGKTGKEIRSKIENLLEPLKIEFESMIKELVREIRS